jgi:hypothetical protein
MEGKQLLVKRNGALGSCKECGAQATKVISVHGVPRDIAPSGTINMPLCDACFAASSFSTKAATA